MQPYCPDGTLTSSDTIAVQFLLASARVSFCHISSVSILSVCVRDPGGDGVSTPSPHLCQHTVCDRTHGEFAVSDGDRAVGDDGRYRHQVLLRHTRSVEGEVECVEVGNGTDRGPGGHKEFVGN